MSLIDTAFRDLRAAGRKTVMPFVTAGDPSLDVTAELLRRFANLGCGLAEIGFPYSDPIADGPVIQASYTRSLRNGTRPQDILAMVAETSPNLQMPLVGMVSFAIVRRRGLAAFVRDACDAGLAGLIVPDLPGDEAGELYEICRAHDLSLVPLVTPTSGDNRIASILQHGSGFVYFVSIAGITGERQAIPSSTLDRVRWLRQQTDLPICVGFGVSEPAQAATIAEVADGVIVGSAIVRRIAESPSPAAAAASAEQFVRELLAAVSPSPPA